MKSSRAQTRSRVHAVPRVVFDGRLKLTLAESGKTLIRFGISDVDIAVLQEAIAAVTDELPLCEDGLPPKIAFSGLEVTHDTLRVKVNHKAECGFAFNPVEQVAPDLAEQGVDLLHCYEPQDGEPFECYRGVNEQPSKPILFTSYWGRPSVLTNVECLEEKCAFTWSMSRNMGEPYGDTREYTIPCSETDSLKICSHVFRVVVQQSKR